MLKTLAFTAAIAAMTVGLTSGASALPAAKQLGGVTDLTLVSDGCGPGKRFSNSRGHCVWKDGERSFRDERRRQRERENTEDAVDAVDSVLGVITGGPRKHRRRHDD